jgi:hypothetical protein
LFFVFCFFLNKVSLTFTLAGLKAPTDLLFCYFYKQEWNSMKRKAYGFLHVPEQTHEPVLHWVTGQWQSLLTVFLLSLWSLCSGTLWNLLSPLTCIFSSGLAALKSILYFDSLSSLTKSLRSDKTHAIWFKKITSILA